MNREIKFRGLGIENPIWHYGLLMQTEVETDDGIFETEYRIYHNKNDFMTYAAVDIKTVGQFIGLKDKNGVEIYEGDILQIGQWDPYKVEWNIKRAMFMLTNVDDSDETVFNAPVGIVKCADTIGNIHENPELLQEG